MFHVQYVNFMCSSFKNWIIYFTLWIILQSEKSKCSVSLYQDVKHYWGHVCSHFVLLFKIRHDTVCVYDIPALFLKVAQCPNTNLVIYIRGKEVGKFFSSLQENFHHNVFVLIILRQ